MSLQSKFSTALASFVPETVKRYILKVAEEGIDLKCPHSESFDTVALFADVSGFTALTDLLAKKGPLGAEEIGFYLNRYLEQLVKIIARSGGDVFKFAGDAIVVLWPPESLGSEVSPSELADMVHRAASCSLNIQSELHDAALDIDDKVKMSLKLGIGVGRVTVLHVGGVHGRIEYLPAGAPLLQAFRAEHSAQPGDSIMSIEAWRMVEAKFTGDIIDDHNVRLRACTCPIRNISVRRTQVQWRGSLALLQMYVPAAVVPYLKINQKLWSAELRQVSVVFVNLGFKLDHFEDRVDNQALVLLQTVISSIQMSIYRYEGSLNKFLVDDKGSTLLVVFGLPPLAHENDPCRAVLASLQISRVMSRLGMRTNIGVTSGLALCGLVGSGSRREYSVIGDLVNLSARLMQAANGSVLCDTATYLAARTQRRILFNRLPPIMVKGKTETVEVFCPEFRKLAMHHVKTPLCSVTVGQGAHIHRVAELVLELQRAEYGQIAFVEGEIGSGKTHILRHLTHLYSDRAVFAWGRGDAFTKPGSFHIWKNLFVNLNATLTWFHGTNELRTGESPFGTIEAALTDACQADRPDMLPYLSTCNGILMTSFPATVECRLLDVREQDALALNPNARPTQRLQIIINILTIVLHRMAEKQRIILVMDECQYLGRNSWSLMSLLCENITKGHLPHVSVIIASRPIDVEKYRLMFQPLPQEYTRIKGLVKMDIFLENLTRDDVATLLRTRLEAPVLDDQLVSLVNERTGGRPLFCYKFIEALLHVNALIKDKESCRLSAEWLTRGEWDTELPIPYRIQRITASHLDRMSPSQTMLLKVASVICVAQGEGALGFKLGMVRRSNPITEYVSSISSDIQMLIKHGMLLDDDPHGSGPGNRVVELPHVQPAAPVQSEEIEQSNTPQSTMWHGDDDDNRNLFGGDASDDANGPVHERLAPSPDDGKTYRFAYGFLRDFLYQIMLYTQRQKLHRICCDYIEAHLSECADVEQEEMVLSRHVILSGSVTDQIDEQSMPFAGMQARRSTVLPQNMSTRGGANPSFRVHRRIVTDTNMADMPRISHEVSRSHATGSATNRNSGTLSEPFGLMRRFLRLFVCFSTKGSMAVIPDAAGLSRTDSRHMHQISITQPREAQAQVDLFSETAASGTMQKERSLSSMFSQSRHESPSAASGYLPAAVDHDGPYARHQRTSIGILQELRNNPALDAADRSSIGFVLKTMMTNNDSDPPSRLKSLGGSRRTLPLPEKETINRPLTALVGGSMKNITALLDPSDMIEETPSTRARSVGKSSSAAMADRNPLMDLEDDEQEFAKLQFAKELLEHAGMSGATKTMTSTNDLVDEELRATMDGLDTWDFDVFRITILSQCQPLVLVGFELFNRYDLLRKFDIPEATLLTFLVGIEYGYNRANIAYHSSVHAADVTQTVHFLIGELGIYKDLSDMDTLAIVVGSLIHDYRHPGQTNQFLVNIEDERAILFNDIRVLENFHCSAAFKFMRHDDVNILKHLTAAQRKQFRQQTISLVLATSLSDHFEFVEKCRSTVEACGALDATNEAHRSMLLTLTIKCADISNACKPWPVANVWASRIMEEFYNQGDVERSRGIAVSSFMDRNNPSMASCQVTFINMFVRPLFDIVFSLHPHLSAQLSPFLEQNLEHWSELSRKECIMKGVDPDLGPIEGVYPGTYIVADDLSEWDDDSINAEPYIKLPRGTKPVSKAGDLQFVHETKNSCEDLDELGLNMPSDSHAHDLPDVS